MNTRTRNRRQSLIANALPFEALERRQLMSATSIKTIDTGGPDDSIVEAGGHVYVVSSHASGGGWTQIWTSDGPKNTSKVLIDTRKSSLPIGSFDDLTAAADGSVYFTATGGTNGGRQVFKLDAKAKNGYRQLTSTAQSFYSQLIAVGSQLFMFDSTNERINTFDSKGNVKKVVDAAPVKMFTAKGQLFYSLGDDGVFRTDGTAAGTYKVNGDLNVGVGHIFVSNDYIYFEGTKDNNVGLFRSDGSKGAPQLIADDFSFSTTSHAELNGYVYFSGGYYNTSPLAKGGQLYKINQSTGEIAEATSLSQAEGGARVDGVSAIGTNIYFIANDGEFVNSAGTPDRELWRYNTVSGTTTKITTDETLFPIEMSGGVLSSYYFVAAPTKADSRFGSRRLYRTSPTDDKVEQVAGMPSYTDVNKNTKEDVNFVFAGSRGLFYSARNDDQPGDADTYFVPTPFSYVDPVTKKLTIEGTASSDNLQIKVVGNNLSMTLNGATETAALSSFDRIDIYLKDGNDKVTTASNVDRNMSVFGDSGDDYIQTGSGNDYVLTGAGKNTVYGGAGDDKLKGAGGQEKLYGEDGADELYGRGGSDILDGGAEIDVLRGDDATGPAGNDTLRGGSSNDRLYGFGGNDVLEGGKQNDSLVGGAGNDLLVGDIGDDFLDGGAGTDDLRGGEGDDSFVADDGSLDILDGGAGNDSAKKDTKEKKVFSIELIV